MWYYITDQCWSVADPPLEGGKNYFQSKMLMLQSDIAWAKWAKMQWAPEAFGILMLKYAYSTF